MPRSHLLVLLLVALSLTGLKAMQSILIPELSAAGQITWSVYLVALPVALAVFVWIGWIWTAMGCVIYGTIGLALDLATMTGLLGEHGGLGARFVESALSGGLNLTLIVVGGRAFVNALQGPSLREFRPPNPRPPSSFDAT